jgi:hypothetical protein
MTIMIMHIVVNLRSFFEYSYRNCSVTLVVLFTVSAYTVTWKYANGARFRLLYCARQLDAYDW